MMDHEVSTGQGGGKLTETQNFKSSVAKKDLSMKDLKVIANYVGKRY